MHLLFVFARPLHMCVASWNVAVVRRWVEVASFEEIAEAINILSPVGTALSMAAAVKKDHEKGGYIEARDLWRVTNSLRALVEVEAKMEREELAQSRAEVKKLERELQAQDIKLARDLELARRDVELAGKDSEIATPLDEQSRFENVSSVF